MRVQNVFIKPFASRSHRKMNFFCRRPRVPASRCDETFIMLSPPAIFPLSSMIRLIFLNININCEFHTAGQVSAISSSLK